MNITQYAYALTARSIPVLTLFCINLGAEQDMTHSPRYQKHSKRAVLQADEPDETYRSLKRLFESQRNSKNALIKARKKLEQTNRYSALKCAHFKKSGRFTEYKHYPALGHYMSNYLSREVFDDTIKGKGPLITARNFIRKHNKRANVMFASESAFILQPFLSTGRRPSHFIRLYKAKHPEDLKYFQDQHKKIIESSHRFPKGQFRTMTAPAYLSPVQRSPQDIVFSNPIGSFNWDTRMDYYHRRTVSVRPLREGNYVYRIEDRHTRGDTITIYCIGAL